MVQILLVTLLCVIVILGCFLMFTLNLALKVCIRVKMKDSLLLLLPGFTILVLGARLFFYGAWLNALEKSDYDDSEVFASHCAYISVYLLPSYCFPASALINLFIWINFIMGSTAFHQQKFQRFIKRRKILLLILTLCSLAATLPMIQINHYWCSKNSYRPLSVYNIIFYLLLAMAFPVVGYLLLKTLKGFSPYFYEKIRKEIKLTVVLLCFAFVIRGGMNVAFLENEHYLDRWYFSSIKNNTWGAPLYLITFTVCADLLPVTSHLISLNFTLKEKEKAV